MKIKFQALSEKKRGGEKSEHVHWKKPGRSSPRQGTISSWKDTKAVVPLRTLGEGKVNKGKRVTRLKGRHLRGGGNIRLGVDDPAEYGKAIHPGMIWRTGDGGRGKKKTEQRA